MKVLWFTNIPLQAVQEHRGETTSGTGFWMNSLVEPLNSRSEISRLGIVWAGVTKTDEHFETDGVDYYTVAQSRLGAVYGLGNKRDEDRALRKITEIIAEFKPDIIHIHGTERFYGLLKVRKLVSIPTVVSIQGLMGPYAKYAWGDKSFWDVLKTQGKWDAVRGFPSLKARRSLVDRSKLECEILRSVDGIIGRTDWDKAYVWSMAPKQRYFHVDEMMRPEFFEDQWSLESCQRHRIYTSGRLTFLKGMHSFIEAMALLKREYPDLSVRIAGDNAPTAEYRSIRQQVKKLGLSQNVDFLGWIPGSKIVEELKDAHVYSNPSFIENSPNSVCEAMLMALPCVCSTAGGLPSLMTDQKEGLMVRPGEPAILAYAIRELFENKDKAYSLGQAGKDRANKRHSVRKITQDLLEVYLSFY